MDSGHFRLLATMKQGTPSSIPETWMPYDSVEDARTAAKQAYHDDRVLRVMIVADNSGKFLEWIDR